MLHVLDMIAWSGRYDEQTAAFQRGDIVSTRKHASSASVVAAMKSLLPHKNNLSTQATLTNLLKHFSSLPPPSSSPERPSEALVRLLRERLAERRALLDDLSELVGTEDLLPLLDAQILQLREALQASRSWFSPELLVELGMPPLATQPPPIINHDWHLPPPPRDNSPQERTRSMEELFLNDEINQMRFAIEHINSELETVKDAEKRKELENDLTICLARKARLEKSLKVEKRIRDYARQATAKED